MAGLIRAIISLVASGLALIALATVWTPTGPRGTGAVKLLNDIYGHSTGTDGTAVIGRAGGEEFLVADAWCPDEVQARAKRLCDAIAALPFGVTASVGTAGVHGSFTDRDAEDLLAELISAADAAMYAAKRRGGNQVGRHVALPPYRGGGVSARND